MNKQGSRARSSEFRERGLIGILIAVADERSALGVFARDLKRLQHQSYLGSLCPPRLTALLSTTKRPSQDPAPVRSGAVLEGPKYSLEYTDASDTRSNARYLGSST